MSTVQKELRKIAGELSPADIEFCKEETQKIADLSPKMFAKVFSVLYIVDLLGAEKAGKIRIARLKMNRKPKVKAVESLVETICGSWSANNVCDYSCYRCCQVWICCNRF